VIVRFVHFGEINNHHYWYILLIIHIYTFNSL
jgi:hypothetical protein